MPKVLIFICVRPNIDLMRRQGRQQWLNSRSTLQWKINNHRDKEDQAEILKKKEDIDKEGLEDIVAKLKTSLEDCTGVCILEGFQKQEPMILVDAILKELGKTSIQFRFSFLISIF